MTWWGRLPDSAGSSPLLLSALSHRLFQPSLLFRELPPQPMLAPTACICPVLMAGVVGLTVVCFLPRSWEQEGKTGALLSVPLSRPLALTVDPSSAFLPGWNELLGGRSLSDVDRLGLNA